MKKNKAQKTLALIKGARGEERKAHFEGGGTLIEWRGGPRTVTRNRKKYTRKSKHKGRY